MKKFLKSLGQLNNSQIRATLATVHHSIEETATAQLQGENIKVIAHTTKEGEVHVNIAVNYEEHTTAISFKFSRDGGFFTEIVMQEVQKPKPSAVNGLSILVAMLKGSDNNITNQN